MVQIVEPNDGPFITGETVSGTKFMEENAKLKKSGKKQAKGENILLPITKVSLATDSFLSAASFQETTRVLIQAATNGRVDNLRGLKENVIIGKLVPVGTGFKKK